MKQKKYWLLGIIVLLGIILIGGYIKQSIQLQDSKNSFLSLIEGINLENSYTIKEHYSYASSGGGSSGDVTREIKPAELKEIINEIKDINIIGFFSVGNRVCYYNEGSFPNYFICFVDNKIVNYIQKDGPTYIYWNTPHYEFNMGRSIVISSIKDLKKCNTDSDCTLTSSGVCDPTGKCETISVSCDPGCRTSINSKYYMAWDFVPLIEDQCIPSKCSNREQKEYFRAACINNVCEAQIVK